MKRIILLSSAIAFSVFSYAQQAIRKADYKYSCNAYYNAQQYYSGAAAKAGSKAQKAYAYFQAGECARMNNDTKAAITNYGKAIKAKTDRDDVYLRLAQCQMMKGDYLHALENFTEYKKRVPSDPAADTGIVSCSLAPQWMIDSTRWKVTNVKELNTEYSDFCPAWFDKKHNALMFTSKRPGQTGSKIDPNTGNLYSDMFQATESKTGHWNTPQTVAGDVNLPMANDGACSVTKNGSHIFFT
ncbi:MAG TPA: tetratricopeptide repeat protein, partial [Bacteroidia bacterium]|nr:tetratricopeptide repeat protein [Bacteroidia bacterium]